MNDLVQSTLENGHPLTVDGDQIDNKLLEDLSEQQQADLLAWIISNVLPRKTANKSHSSYGIKHYAEKDLGFYISNNQFKDAMLQCGFQPVNPHQTNWIYKISNKSPFLSEPL